MQPTRKAVITTIGLILLVVLFFVGLQFWEKGYRVGLPGIILAPGVIQVDVYDPNSQIFLDGDLISGSIPKGIQTLRIPVPRGSHELTVSKDKFYPWQKTLEVDPKETVEVSPYELPAATNGVVLPKSDKEYAPALAAIKAMKLPAADAPLSSNDNLMQVYLKDKELIAKVPEGKTPPQYFCTTECATEHSVITLDADVRGVAFLPGRNDIVLIAVGNSVFALELDTRGTQNYQPVYQGIKPSFAPGPGYLYVTDNDSVFIVSLYPSQ